MAGWFWYIQSHKYAWFSAYQGAHGPCSVRGRLGQSIAPHSQAWWPSKHQGTSGANGWRWLEMVGVLWRYDEIRYVHVERNGGWDGMKHMFILFHILHSCFLPNMQTCFDPHPLCRGIIGWKQFHRPTNKVQCINPARPCIHAGHAAWIECRWSRRCGACDKPSLTVARRRFLHSRLPWLN